ncbi:hypothetical protein M441DRAFT_318793 [Trichoderma asperellum CBS 433.97]|uniref:Uncharacterized protein n=1 Tax=Trichoderma asperellum (strain ATCC 204424 / CBS 433.97 / NBRC 101777) TaxID=1042311 RepID=A0A2T3ZL18_TRIA4|nr:hypothetical protein M441DRAFT_318793 [Trichoderma asperellum CBS 433.97]PTB45500.1 hypothetical protein M441DRAFT_318793 [Trichoderma asperellum CBS 433.97]
MPRISQSIARVRRASTHQSKRPCGLSGTCRPSGQVPSRPCPRAPHTGRGRSTLWGPDWYLPVDTQALQPRSSASQNETRSNSNSAKQKTPQKKKNKPRPVANKSTSNQHPCPAVPAQHSTAASLC